MWDSLRIGLLCDWRWLLLCGLLMAGCRPLSGNIELPEWDPVVAADRAIAEYDANRDQKLSRDELKQCPGLLAALARFDSDGDASISADELKSKLREMRDDQAALVEVTCVVTRNHQPLEGATVTFVPESFLGESFTPASGIVARDGTAFPTLTDEELPAEYRGRIHGVHCGIYRVTVTHPRVDIPAKFNTQTEFGRTITRRDRDPMMIDL